MKRDCAERAVGRIAIDAPKVRGRGDEATLGIGVTFTPPESGTPVHLVDVGGSTLLAPAGSDATAIDRTLTPGGPLRFADLHPEPVRRARRRGGPHRGILPLRVESKAFGSSPVYLRFDEPQKAQIFDYLAERCGFGK